MKPSEWFCWLVLDWVTWPCKIWATNHLSGFVANSKYKIQALFTDFQGPKLHFSSTKIIDKKPYPRRGHSKFRLQCDTEVYCTVLTNTVIIKASDNTVSKYWWQAYKCLLQNCQQMQNVKVCQKFNSRTFQGFSNSFKHLICLLSRALKFLFQIQAFLRISQARYEPWFLQTSGAIGKPSWTEVTTLWRYTNLFIIIIIKTLVVSHFSLDFFNHVLAKENPWGHTAATA